MAQNPKKDQELALPRDSDALAIYDALHAEKRDSDVVGFTEVFRDGPKEIAITDALQIKEGEEESPIENGKKEQDSIGSLNIINDDDLDSDLHSKPSPSPRESIIDLHSILNSIPPNYHPNSPSEIIGIHSMLKTTGPDPNKPDTILDIEEVLQTDLNDSDKVKE